MKWKRLKSFKVISNAFFLVPFAAAVHWHIWAAALLCLCVAFFGTLYHYYNEKRFLLPDSTSSWLLIATNLVLCYLGGFKFPYFFIALLFLVLALVYNYYLQLRGQYSLNHGLWHLYGSLITLFSILTFVL